MLSQAVSRFRATLLIALTAALAASLTAGCGGGGGGPDGGGGGPAQGRSFTFVEGDRAVAISVDTQGRFTVFVKDAAHPNGLGAQGSVDAAGRVIAQGAAGLQVNGQVSSAGDSVAGSVQLPGGATFDFTAAILPAGRANTQALSGTFFSNALVNNALITIDLHGNATLFATLALASGGGLLNVSESGAFESADGSQATTGQITRNGASLTLRIDKLNGAAVNTTVILNQSTRAKWTFMVFLNAANDLEEFGPLNVNQMEKVGSTADVNIVLQWKRARCSTCGNPDWVGTRRYFVTRDNDTSTVNSQLVESLGTTDMGDWRELRNFILWAQSRYPADRYAVVIWNHGAGWRPTRSVRSVSIDDHTQNEIQTWELPLALNVNPRPDVVIFDASLMQMTEVVYEIRNSTPVVVGSEESPPGEGYVYDPFLADLAANPDMTGAQLGTRIVVRTKEAYGENSNITQSAIDTSKMQNVADKLHLFANRLIAHISDSRTAMVDARAGAESYAYPDNKDLWDYANRIKNGTSADDLKAAAADVQAAVEAAVIAEAHGRFNAGSHGLAIYVPAPLDYLTSYANLALARATDWDRWLQEQPNSRQ